MKLVVGQRVMVANPLNATQIPDPCFGHVVDIGMEPFYGVSGVIVAIFNPIPDCITSMFIRDEHIDEALTAVD